jgi:hypothetical protein
VSQSDISRRAFVTAIGGGLTLAAAPELLARDPYRPLGWRAPGPPIRLRGRVSAAGRPLARVAVSDGLTVTVTDADGRYAFIGDSRMPAVFISVPAGHALPVSRHGTFAHYQRIGRGAEQQADFVLDRLDTDDLVHQVMVLADPQTRDGAEMAAFQSTTVPEVVAARSSESDFGMTIGDIMYDHLELYPEYERAVQRMGMPFGQVVGNHDLDQDAQTDDASTRTFIDHFGPPWYSFNRGRVHYVVLDDVFWHGSGYIGHVGAEQLLWLQQDLALVEPGAPVVVFTHIPLSTTTPERNPDGAPAVTARVTNAAALWRLLEPFSAHVLTGHTHENEHIWHGPKAHEHNIATACGAWWTGPICYDGTPSGFAVYQVDGEAISWRYQATGRPAGDRLTVYPAGSDPAAPGELIANVWDWDPSWEVAWYEGGDRRGVMERRDGRDPWSAILHGGPALPPKHPWVDPIVTKHLFRVPVPARHGTITVEAIDRFGHQSSAVPMVLPPR